MLGGTHSGTKFLLFLIGWLSAESLVFINDE